MTFSARPERFGRSFVLALTGADAAYTAGQFAELFAQNPPNLGGIPDGILASDLFMMLAIFAIQWPVILLLALPPALGAFAYQKWSNIKCAPVFVAVGAAIGLYCATLAYFTVLQWLSDTPDFPNPAYLVTNIAPLGVIAGAFGGFVYRRTALGASRG